jgi:hypothetical protein
MKERVELKIDDAGTRNDPDMIDEEGFDISLIHEMLRMTPDERLDWHHGMVRMIEELRHAITL